jgi:hypothetical protein
VLTRLDHLVVLVRDLDRAIRDYETLGFTVTLGGEHADGLTSNALIPFKDSSYLELVAFLDPDDPRDNVWGWRPFLSSGGGLIDYCAASDDLQADVRRLEDLGFDVEGPTDGGRRLPDGAEIRWCTARIHQDGRILPFLIEDLTPVPCASRTDRLPNTPTEPPASLICKSLCHTPRKTRDPSPPLPELGAVPGSLSGWATASSPWWRRETRRDAASTLRVRGRWRWSSRPTCREERRSWTGNSLTG